MTITRFYLRSAFFLSATLFISAGAFAQGAAPSASPGGPLAQALQPFVDNHIVAGIVALVANKEKVLDLEAMGYSSLEKKTPMKGDELFWIASMSKSITATAFMMLVDEGKVSLDDPVERYLPEFKGQMVVDENDPAHKPHPPRHPITIREILSHTSGIAMSKDLTKEQRAAMDDHDLKREIADYAALPLRQEPGTKYEYNNAGIDTAGRIIEVVSGVSFADFMRQRFLDPLGMRDTTWWPDQEQGARLARSVKFTADKTGIEELKNDSPPEFIKKLTDKYLGGNSNIVPPNVLSAMSFRMIIEYGMHYAMPAGGLFSTAGDLAKFCQMVLNGGVYNGRRYLSEDAIKQMTSVQTGTVFPNSDYGYGLGWTVKRTASGLPGAGSFGHRGAGSPHMWIDREKQLVMIVLVQRLDMPGKDENNLYDAFLKAAIDKYGHIH